MKSSRLQNRILTGLKPAILSIGLLLLAGPSTPLLAQGNFGNPGILPPHSHPYGKTYAQWSAAHWQWTYSISADQHPLLQDGNVDLSLDQPPGPVWFIGGSFVAVPVPGGFLATANRTGTLPADKTLFFPIIDAECSTAEGNGNTEADLRACAVSDVDPASGVACEIDNQPVRNLEAFRIESPLFTFGPLPADNLLGLPAGVTSPSVSDGFFLMLAPLAPGAHTIHFTAEVPGFALDITYHLTVLANQGKD